ncbi:OLC1v1004599C1 [Oldenlandia corymbosa var. corymbosa]|uniref:OLC1v1004599C1 n=1 Tax=Oldenlandia corymbosa var. corymbosa TaxID=529605 RepID=A0AAV1DF51_OLDCO|nr:OLC1v1004599C1 [Oldenlandia corymbosa var. corymbosa]
MEALRVRLRSSNPPTILPDDVMMGIFSTVPMKDLVRLRRVCKSWQNLITSLDMFKVFQIQTSLSRQKTSPNCQDFVEFLLLDDCKYDNGDKTPDLQIRERLSKLTVKLAKDDNLIRTHRLICKDGVISLVGCCHGLLCFSKQGEINCDVYLCNPVLGQVRALPKSKLDSIGSSKNAVVTFFYDDYDNDYKAVKIVEFCNFLKVGVYSLKNNSWKIFSPLAIPWNRVFLLKVSNGRSQLLVHKGCIYLLVYLLACDDLDGFHGPYFLIILDVNNGEARTIPLPNGPDLPPCPLNLLFFKGSVAFSSWFFSNTFRFDELWVFQEDGNYSDNLHWMFKKDEWERFWRKKSVSQENCPPHPLLPYRTTGVTMGRNELYFLSSIKGSEFVYDIQSRDLWDHPVADYVPSLVSVMTPSPSPPPPPSCVETNMENSVDEEESKDH